MEKFNTNIWVLIAIDCPLVFAENVCDALSKGAIHFQVEWEVIDPPFRQSTPH